MNSWTLGCYSQWNKRDVKGIRSYGCNEQLWIDKMVIKDSKSKTQKP